MRQQDTPSNLWTTTSPFLSNEWFRNGNNGNNIFLRDTDNVEAGPSNVSELSTDYFLCVATDMEFEDRIIASTSDAVDKHNPHQRCEKNRQLVDENCMALIKNKPLAKPPGMIICPVRSFRLLAKCFR